LKKKCSKSRLRALSRGARHVLGLSVILLVAQNCSTAENGRCKSFKDPKYVASSMDTDGKKWEIQVRPAVADLKCDYKAGGTATSGPLQFTATIIDGQGFPKAGLAVSGSVFGGTDVPQVPGFYFDQEKSDQATDSCGVAIFTVNWTCPEAKKSAGGYFYVSSGPLSSKEVKLTIEHPVQQDQVIVSPTK